MAYFMPNRVRTWRAAVSISKTKYKLAVERNLIRRQVKAIMREQFCNLNAVDVLVIINQGFLELTSKEKQTIFLNLCQKLQELDAPKPK